MGIHLVAAGFYNTLDLALLTPFNNDPKGCLEGCWFGIWSRLIPKAGAILRWAAYVVPAAWLPAGTMDLIGRYVGAKDNMEPLVCLYLWAKVRKRDECLLPAPATAAADVWSTRPPPTGFGWWTQAPDCWILVVLPGPCGFIALRISLLVFIWQKAWCFFFLSIISFINSI